MEKTPLHYTAALGSASENLRVVNAGVSYPADAVLGIDSRNASTSCISKGSKRKWSLFDGADNLKDGSCLAFGLGQSLSSSTIISSGKEMEEESSLHLGLSIKPHLQNNSTGTFNPRNFSLGAPNTSEAMKLKIDLELSLSTAPAESDITTVTQGSSPYQNNSQALGNTVQPTDDGSASSRWITGPLVPPLWQTKSSTPFDQVHSSMNPIPVVQSVLSSAVVPKNSVASTSGVARPPKQRNTSVKTCRFEGCTRGARGASGLCISHGGGRRCQRAGCQKGAEGKTVFCKAHGGGRRCQYLGCTKSAEGRTDYCIGHGGGRRCNHEDCTRAARGKSGLCIRHGGGKRCKMDNCIKSAEGVTGLCISHGGGRRCEYPGCTKGAQGSTVFCKAHGGGKRCTFLGCFKGAEGSTPFCKGHGGGKRCTFEGCTKSVHGGTSFCVSHGGGKRCAMLGCTRSARGRTNFCVRHGGGKRCKFEGCTKSAQGSTDFCKAHGGGKRCSWGQMGSEFGGEAATPCDKFPRGKSGLCAAHSAQVKEKQIYGSDMVNPVLQDPQSTSSEKMKGIVAVANSSFGGSILLSGYEHQSITLQNIPHDNLLAESGCLDHFSLPEGRVHGGSLMAMLRGNAAFGASDRLK